MKTVLFAIPAYGQSTLKASDACIMACRTMLAANRIYSDEISISSSHIDRGRNTLSYLALTDFKLPKELPGRPNPQWDSIVMIDGDISTDFGRLAHNIKLNLDMPDRMGFIAHPCPLKSVPPKPNWKGTLKHLSPKDKRWTEDVLVAMEGPYATVEQIGAGCVIISRLVLEKAKAWTEQCEQDYRSDSADPNLHGKQMWNLWASGVNQKPVHDDNAGWESRSWDSEDYAFCNLLNNIGTPILVDLHPAARCTHYGLYPYKFDENSI
jgi:hypothetical protein